MTLLLLGIKRLGLPLVARQAPRSAQNSIILLHIAAHKGRTSWYNVLELSCEGARDLRNGAWQVVPMRDTKEVRASPAPILRRQSHPAAFRSLGAQASLAVTEALLPPTTSLRGPAHPEFA